MTVTRIDRTPSRTPADAALLKALTHPLRWQILARLNEGSNTPAGLARVIGERTENVAYHVRVLCELGLIELVSATPVRGTIEHRYRAMERAFITDDDAASLSPKARAQLSQGVVRDAIADLIDSAGSAAFMRRHDGHYSRTPLVVDQRGWDEINDLVAGVLDRVLQIQAESLSRLEGDPSGEVPSEVVLLHFPRDPGRAD